MLDQNSWLDRHVIGEAAASSVRDLGSNVVEFSETQGRATRIEGLSMIFEPVWYRSRYLDPVGCVDPIKHYLQTGWRIGCDPNPYFSTRDYMAANADVSGGDFNPFLHYVFYGAAQGRRPRADG